jgi:hypothetical protein
MVVFLVLTTDWPPARVPSGDRAPNAANYVPPTAAPKQEAVLPDSLHRRSSDDAIRRCLCNVHRRSRRHERSAGLDGYVLWYGLKTQLPSFFVVFHSSDGTSSAESDATVDKSSSDESKSGIDANASSTCRLPSRSSSRKQRRPDHFILEEADASARAKARRSTAALDRFLTSVLRISPGQSPEWVRDVTADNDRGQGQGGSDGSRFRTALFWSSASSGACSSTSLAGEASVDGRR